MDGRAGARIRLGLAWALAAAPVLAFYAVLFRWRSSIPVADDYTALLGFGLRWQGLHSAGGRALLLLRVQDGDYKLWLDHLCVMADLLVSGRVHIGLWVWAGNLLLLVIAWLLWRHTLRSERVLWRRVLGFAPVTLLLFQLNFAETVDWAMAGLQNLGVIACALLAIHLWLGQSRAAAACGCAVACVAVAASANGFLLLPIGAWLLWRRRAFALLASWCVLFAGMAAGYHDGLHLAPKHAVSAGQFLQFVLAFAGGGIENMHHLPLAGASLVLGSFLLLLLVILLRRSAMRASPFAFWGCVWVLLTAVLVAAGRAGFGPEIALAGRYKIYCDLLLVFAYLLALGDGVAPPRLWLRSAVVLGAAGMCVASGVAGERFLHARHDELLAGAERFRRSGGAVAPLRFPEEPHAQTSDMETMTRLILLASEQTGMYALPAVHLPQ